MRARGLRVGQGIRFLPVSRLHALGYGSLVQGQPRPQSSQFRCATAALMPERDDFECAAAHSVIHEVVDAAQVEPPYDLRTRRFYFGANARFSNKQFESAAKVRHHCAWGGGTIL